MKFMDTEYANNKLGKLSIFQKQSFSNVSTLKKAKYFIYHKAQPTRYVTYFSSKIQGAFVF